MNEWSCQKQEPKSYHILAQGLRTSRFSEEGKGKGSALDLETSKVSSLLKKFCVCCSLEGYFM